ncbi:hypothetical protein AYO21_02224 [Fonsecaea monophora]|uniref:Uncharacterized protein n=1 Tax=Fonsecaea monophora TaxID=254056 RepID=A0A177FHB2_9EURO|nr:hypothetical protein AYO21_02224 [Fonsecaea monophora]OAG43638.1 hypothetical protein AYO21_02224 [Fonsecaea monophora]
MGYYAATSSWKEARIDDLATTTGLVDDLICAQNRAHDSTIEDDKNCISAQPVDSTNLINTTDADGLANLPVHNSHFTTTNSLRVGTGKEIEIDSLTDDFPSGPAPTTGKPATNEPGTTPVSASLYPNAVFAEEDREGSEEEVELTQGQTPAAQKGDIITEPADTKYSAIETGGGSPDRLEPISHVIDTVEKTGAKGTEPGDFFQVIHPRETVVKDDDDSLDHYNIPWGWDPEDDYYVFVKEYLTKERRHELRPHTA